MSDHELICLSLTGEKSHSIQIPVGQGSLSIGTRGLSKGKYDVWVEKECSVNWDAFNACFTRAGQQASGLYPYGDWPRFFYYSGNDQGFIPWSMKRRIEEFHWSPQEDAFVDLSKANITRLGVHTDVHTLKILVGDKIRDFFLSGTLENIEMEEHTCMPPYLYFSPSFSKRENEPYQLPVFNAFKHATSVDVSIEPLGRAFDCNSLLQFHALTSLDLTGNLTHLEALSELKQLESIGLRYVPDLSHMPKLADWVNLNSFIGYNIEETKGKLLRAELNQLLKKREMDYSSVTKLRKATWFTTEYGIPFSDWDLKNSKIATRAYKACLKQIQKAPTKRQVQEAIVCFIEAINPLDRIETSEREDVWLAVTQLVACSTLDISQETAQQWFDENRVF